MIKLVILLFLINTSLCFDYIQEALKIIDFNSDPCDNFYRHACPLSSPAFLQRHLIWNDTRKTVGQIEFPAQLTIQKDFEVFARDNNDTTWSQIVADKYLDLCDSGGDTGRFLQFLEFVLLSSSECENEGCMGHLKEDKDCRRVADHLAKVVVNRPEDKNAHVISLLQKTNSLKRELNIVTVHKQVDIEKGITYSKDTLLNLKRKAREVIENTPWVTNHKVTELLLALLAPVSLQIDLDGDQKFFNDTLHAINKKYEECKAVLPAEPVFTTALFCGLYTEKHFLNFKVPTEIGYITVDGAFSIYPRIGLGFNWFYLIQNIENEAAKLGALGFPLAHELSHTLIKGREPDFFTYFSDEAKQCVQKQYESSWNEFREDDISIKPQMFEENGADVFALQLVLSLLEEQYQGKQFETPYNEQIKNLGQLFFYSAALSMCSGSSGAVDADDVHAATNVRMNAFANHPAFQQAFQCADDSRMIKSRTQHCSIYGQDAPQHRKFRNNV